MNRAPNGTVQFVDEVSGAIHTPVSVATDILNDLIERVKKATEMKISRLVVTIPADFKQYLFLTPPIYQFFFHTLCP